MYTLKIEQDFDHANPRTEWDNLGKMVCFHNRYSLGDEHGLNADDFDGWDAMKAHLIKGEGAAIILPLYLYDHSGITIKTVPFSDKWDSGQIGFIYMTKTDILKEAPGSPKIITKTAREWAINYLEGEVKTYDQYLTGDVWGYVIEDENGEHIDSCWDFYGEDYCREEGEASLAYHNEQAKKQAKIDLHQNNKKTLELIKEIKANRNQPPAICNIIKTAINELLADRKNYLEIIGAK